MSALPTDPKARKDLPVYSGFVKYFPRGMVAVAKLSKIGNDQHNPGKPLHWDRSKSGDELDAQMRHILDFAAGVELDTDNVPHPVKNAWRAMANLEKYLEAKAAEGKDPLDWRPQAPVVGQWSEWSAANWKDRGRRSPPADVQDCTMVEVELASGEHMKGAPGHFDWAAMGFGRIVRYRVVSP